MRLLFMSGQDNRDAEAFLKPVSKSEVPDYYDGMFAVLACGEA